MVGGSMQNIETYMILDKENRTKHLDLNSACIEIGGNSIQFRGLLAHHLGTTIPKAKTAQCCHACNNAKCSNPLHLYWGTYSENLIDAYKNGRKSGLEILKQKMSPEEYSLWRKNLSAKGGSASSTKLSEERINEIRNIYLQIDKTYGWLTRFADKLQVSHTQARRLIKKYVDPQFGP